MKLLLCACFVIVTWLAGCQKAAVEANQPEVFKDLPEQQKQFCLIRNRVWAKGGSVAAEVKALLGSSGNFVGWRGVGSVRRIDYSNALAVTFTPVCPNSDSVLYFQTGKVDAANTNIPVGSSFANTLQGNDFSQGMIATGKLLRAADDFLIARFEMISPAHFFPPANAGSNSTAKPSPAGAGSNAGLTDQQVQLCKLNNDFLTWQAPPPETNPIKLATAQPVREPDWNGRLQSILGDGTFTDWKVVIYSMMVNEYKEVSINVHFTCPDSNHRQITLATNSADRTPWTHQRSTIPATSPQIGSAISNLLSTLKQDDTVTVSGKIFYQRQYIGDPLFPVVYTNMGREHMGARNLVVRFDRMSR